MKYTSQFPCRCSRRACQQRVTLRRHPKDYLRAPKCKGCGGREFRVDRYRKKIEIKLVSCDCNGYGHPHKKGSKWCRHAKNEPSAEDIAARYGSDYRAAAAISPDCPF